jgi:diguanylate cyclase
MGFIGRASTTFISLIVGIPYCFYNLYSLQSVGRSIIDFSVLIIVTFTIYWLGKQYDKVKYYQMELEIKQKQLINSYKELKEFQIKLKQMAYFDELTALPNRTMLYDYLKKSIALLKHDKNMLVVLFVDLDGFKVINDTTGHYIGDRLLVEAGKRIKSCIRNRDIVSRLGGDEFIVVLNQCDKNSATEVAHRILNEVSMPYHLNNHLVHITASIGASIAPKNGEDEELLIQRADKAMYYAKSQGKNTFKFYDVEFEALHSK